MWARPLLVPLDGTPPLLVKPRVRLILSSGVCTYRDRSWHSDLHGRRKLRATAESAAGAGTGTGARVRKTKTTVRLEDLPQGLLSLAEPADTRPSKDAENDAVAAVDDGGPSYPTVVAQARRNMSKFKNCVLLTRVGGFYELYFEHAEEYGPLLNLKVAQKKTSAGSVPMAGFPFFQLDRFLKILVQDLNRYVAVAEEFPNPALDKVKSGGLLHDRRVARVITPGTLIDENFIDPYANNYVLAIHTSISAHDLASPNVGISDADTPLTPGDPSPVPLGLAWLDLSTGQFFTQATTLEALSSALSHISPREVVLDEELGNQKNHDVFAVLSEDRHLVTFSSLHKMRGLADWVPMLESEVPAHNVASFTEGEIIAGSLLLQYVKERLLGMSIKLQPPQRRENMDIMHIDRNSMRALELKQTNRDANYRGSLLHAIRRTVTKSGARLLNEWLSAPSTSLDVINARQDLVARFIDDADLRDAIILLLRRSHDSQRLAQKFALGRGDPDDLLAVASTVYATENIASLLLEASAESAGGSRLAAMASRLHLDETLKLAGNIRNAIDEEGIIHQHQVEDGEAGEMMALAQDIISAEGSQDDAAALSKVFVKKANKRPTSVREYYADDSEAWVMKPNASPALAHLHHKLSSLHAERETLVESLRAAHGTPSLTLRWTPGLGHIAHVKGKDARTIGDAAVGRPISASRSTRSFHLPEWTALGHRLDTARLLIRTEEQKVFASLREQVIVNLVKLRRNAAVLDELDIATSFAKLALERSLVRPVLNNSTATTIIGGRHPTVEGGLREQGRTFVKNDCLVGGGSTRLWLITGPNMAGKSTFLRQNALITILAQLGCYVPADYVELGIVDAIFSRVGSADDLYRDQSTFMVEMLETAQILRAATPRSFVIMDEIGRGTTPEDGTAVAYASLHHLVAVNQCRALFATHFHAVADLAVEAGLCGGGNGDIKAVEMHCTDVEEDEHGGFVYVHKLRKGINRQSHALKVAQLAGLPLQAMRTAKQVLDRHEYGHAGNNVQHQRHVGAGGG